MSLNPNRPLSSVVSGDAIPSPATGLILMGETSSGDAAALPLNAAGTAIVVATTAASTNIPSVAKIEAASAGNNTLIAAPGASSRLLIWSFNFLSRGAVNVRLLSNATQLSGLYVFSSAIGFAFDSGEGGPLVCGTNEAFIANLSGAVGIDGFILYSIGTV